MSLCCVLTVLDRDRTETYYELCRKQELPVLLSVLGSGTATTQQLDLYGLQETPKAVVITIAAEEKLKRLILAAKLRLRIDIPGNGILLVVPVKSIGGAQAMALLTNNEPAARTAPPTDFPYELIVAIAERGSVDDVMIAARSAGASGGTCLHASNAGARTEKFMGLMLAPEKDVILIAATAAGKARIMRAILEQAGPGTDANAVCFSLPVTEAAGFRRLDEAAETLGSD